MYLSDLIGEDFKSWTACDEIFIQTQTGSGKTTFITETLAPYAAENGCEVLLLINRKILRRQIKLGLAKSHGIQSMTDEEIDSIQSFDGLTVLSYQQVEAQLKENNFIFSILSNKQFRYVVFDEVHYFLQDCIFNRNILYLEEVLTRIRNATKIFLSATIEEVQPYMIEELHLGDWITEEIEIDKNSSYYMYEGGFFTNGRIINYRKLPEFNISKVFYFRELCELLDEINSSNNEKWLIFVNSKSEAETIKKVLTKSFEYLDAEVDEDNPIKEQIIKREKFETEVLITTKVLDNGINIIDEQLKNIVIMTTEKTEFLQMLGRKRCGHNENFKLYVCARKTQYFNALRNKMILPYVQYIKEIDINPNFSQSRFDDVKLFEFCQKMTIIRDGKIEISRAVRRKIGLLWNHYSDVIERLKEDEEAYVKQQLTWIGMEDSYSLESYLGYEDKKLKMQKIRGFMEGYKDVQMDKNEQELFRKKFTNLVEEYGNQLTDRNSRLVGKSKINKFCEEMDIAYEVVAVKNSKFWVVKEVSRIDEENVCN